MKNDTKLIFNESGRTARVIIEDGSGKCGIKKMTLDADTYFKSECNLFFEQLFELFKEFDENIEAHQMRQIRGRTA